MEIDVMNSTLPETGFVRLPHIIGDAKARPPIPPIIPVSKSTWWAGVKSGRFPRPVKLGPRITAWRVEDIRRLISENSFRKTSGANTYGRTNGMGQNHV